MFASLKLIYSLCTNSCTSIIEVGCRKVETVRWNTFNESSCTQYAVYTACPCKKWELILLSVEWLIVVVFFGSPGLFSQKKWVSKIYIISFKVFLWKYSDCIYVMQVRNGRWEKIRSYFYNFQFLIWIHCWKSMYTMKFATNI